METDDFRRALERSSGRSLQEFFDQWLHSPGYPKLAVKVRHDAAKQEAVVEVEQQQVSEKEGGWRSFTFPLTVAWEVEEGRFERRTFDVERSRHTFAIPIARPPLQVRVDPDGVLLHGLSFEPGNDLLLRQLTKGPDVAARIQAAEELVKSGSVASLRAVGEAVKSEPFWGARESMGAALAGSGHAVAVEILAEMIGRESDVRALATIAEKAGVIRDPRITGALVALLDRKPPYRVAAAALRSLGRQRADAPLARLREAATDGGYRGIVASGALRGLGQTRSADAAAHLPGRLGYGREADDAAVAAVEAYGEAARWQERAVRERAVEDLGALVRDPREWVRIAAARALGRLGEKSGAPAVERLAQSVAAQNRPRLEKIARQLEQGDVPQAALEERLEKLEKRCRTLEERVDRTERVES